MRTDARRDDAEAPIVAALRAAGAIVRHLDGLDLPDLMVLFRGKVHLIEVKTGKRKLRLGQETFVLLARSVGVEIRVARTPEQALEVIGVVLERRGA